MSGAAQGAEQVCMAMYGTPGSALQVHHCQWHCCDVKSHTLHTWKESILSQFKSKARQHSSSAPKPLPSQHPRTADPAWPRDKGTTPGEPRGRGTPQLSQAAGLVPLHVPVQRLGSVCAVSCTLLYGPPSV